MWHKIFTGKERRRFVRLNKTLDVDFRLNGEDGESPLHKGTTKDISVEGLCLVTDSLSKEMWEEAAQKKKRLHLYIYFPDENVKAVAEVERIDIEADIIWKSYGKREGKVLCLLGLQFTRIEKEGQNVIRKYIADNLIKDYHPV